MADDDIVSELCKLTDLSVPKFPENKLEADLLEAAFSLEREELASDKHEKIVFDLHGLSFMEDDPPSVETKLCELETEINSHSHKKALELARDWNPTYTDNRDFRLMFLRSKRFDVQKAAQQLVLHFESKRHLFGDGDILGRDVRLGDLDEEAKGALESGFVQVFPTRDASGRPVFCFSPEWGEDCSLEDVCRAMWYYYMVTHQDDEYQRRGFVFIFYNFGTYNESAIDTESARGLLDGLPEKIVAFHYCTDDESQMPYVGGARLFMDGDERHRMREHIGTPQEVDFKLQTFGIPTKDGPMRPDGTLLLDWHRDWLHMQRTREGKGLAIEGNIVVPRRYDILFGRSKLAKEHTGNLRLIHLCSARLHEYESANKPTKTRIAESLLSTVRDSHGRFLKWEDDGWIEVDGKAAREKISHFFRHLRSKGGGGDGTDSTKPVGKRAIAHKGGPVDT